MTGFVPTSGRSCSTGTRSAAPREQARRARPRAHLAIARAVRRALGRGEPAGRRRAPIGGELPARSGLPRRTRDQRRRRLRPRCARHPGPRQAMPNEISQGQRKLVARRGRWPPARARVHGRAGGGPRHRRVPRLGHRLRRIIDAGITILLVDHDMGLVLNICDYIYVIEFGCASPRARRRRSGTTPR